MVRRACAVGIAAELAALADESCRLLPCCCRTIRPCAPARKPTPSLGRHPLASRPVLCTRCGIKPAGVGRPDAPAAYRLVAVGLCPQRGLPLVRPFPTVCRSISDAERAFLERCAERQSIEVVAPCPCCRAPRRWRGAGGCVVCRKPCRRNARKFRCDCGNLPRRRCATGRGTWCPDRRQPSAGRLSLVAVSGRRPRPAAAARIFLAWRGGGRAGRRGSG